MPSLRQFVVTLLALALTFVASRATNAQAAPVSLPAPLVSALLESGYDVMRASPRYYVGELPAGFPASLVPSGPVYIVGGMTNGDQMIAVLADSTRRLAAVFEQMLEESGWIRPAPTPASGFSGASGPYSYFCRDSAMVTAEPLSGSARTYIRVNYRSGQRRSSCSPGMIPSRSRQYLTLPPLTPPKNVQARTSGGGSGNNEVSSHAVLSGGKLDAGAIVAHYSAQLVKAGWTVLAPAVGGGIAAQHLEAKDEAGTSWEGAIVALSKGSNLEVSLTMQPRNQP